MTSRRDHILLKAPAVDVWGIVGDLEAIDRWSPGVESADVVDGVRRCILKRGGEIVETIVSYSADLRRYQYAIQEGIPVAKHLATIDVLDVGDGRSMVVYSFDVEPDDAAQGIVAPVRRSLQILSEIFAA